MTATSTGNFTRISVSVVSTKKYVANRLVASVSIRAENPKKGMKFRGFTGPLL